MSEDRYMQFINGSLTESVASTLTEQEILTGCTIAGMVRKEAISMEVREILLQYNPALPQDLPATGASEYVVFCLSVESGLSAMPAIDDIHCIYLNQFTIKAGVGTYLPLVCVEQGYPRAYKWDEPLLIPHPKIYAYLQSSNSSTPQKVSYRIGFTYVDLGGEEIMEALEVWRSPTA